MSASTIIPVAAAPAMLLTTGARLGPYGICSLLGAGGMGEVYQARDTRLDRDVIVRAILKAFLGLAVFAAPSPVVAAIRNVDCTKGETITTALTAAVPGDTIRVTGTCRERITITTDRLTLDGQGSTILEGGGGTRLSSQGW